MLQRQRRRGMQTAKKKKIIQFSNWSPLQTTALQGSESQTARCWALCAEDAGQGIWVSPRSLAVKKAGNTSRLRRSFLHWKIHGHFSRQWKEKSIFCIILYWSQTINLVLIFLKNIFWNKNEHKIICILPFKLNINLKALTFYKFNF